MPLLASLVLILLPQDPGESFSVSPVSRIKDARIRKVNLGRSTREGLSSSRIHLFFVEGAILVCEPRGYVRRLSLPDLTVGAEARLPASVAFYGLSRAGLLALSNSNNDLRILDPVRLELVKTIEFKAGTSLATSPALDVAFVQSSSGLVTLDLGSGQEVRQHNAGKLSEDFKRRIKRPEGDTYSMSLGNFPNLTCSPDGRYVFCGTGVLHRLAISGLDLLYEEIAPVNSFARDFSVSSDSRLVIVPGHGRSPSYVLSASDLTAKEALIPEEYRLRSLTTDAAKECLIGLEDNRSSQTTVWTFSMRGEKIESYPVSPSFGCEGLVPSPSGKAVAVPFDKGFYWMEWP